MKSLEIVYYWNQVKIIILYHLIDFEAALADSDTGGIYLTMNQDGTGVSNSITLPYNEYISVAWFAYNQNRGNPESKAVKLWKKYYETPKTGEKSSLMTTLGLLLIGCLAIGLFPRKYKIKP